MENKNSLPLSKQISYAVGQLGWSILVNIIALELVYFYLPPKDAGLPYLISQVTFLGILNLITIIAASGRLFDAITDPLIASMSDRSTNKRGRRIPFMMIGALPAALFCALIFMPPVRAISGINVVWLFVTQVLFYVALTAYVTPYFALLPEMGRTADERLNLSTWISITYALGIIIAAQTPAVAGLLQSVLGIAEKMTALQYAVGALAFIAMLLMYVPVFTIDERKYCEGEPSTVPLLAALKTTFSNPNFIYYVVADFSYFMGLTIINTGLLYYVTVLLFQAEAMVGGLLAIMVIISFVFYPVVNILAKRVGKKILIVAAFLAMSVIFLFIVTLGKIPLPNALQAYLVVILYAVPLAFLSVLPNAVLADIAEHDGLQSGQRKEGMYFAARTLMQKFGQTFGILVFAALTSLGKDPGNDLGIRLSGAVGFALCLVAGITFIRYNERKLLREIEMKT